MCSLSGRIVLTDFLAGNQFIDRTTVLQQVFSEETRHVSGAFVLSTRETLQKRNSESCISAIDDIKFSKKKNCVWSNLLDGKMVLKKRSKDCSKSYCFLEINILLNRF